jgi:hypothetical protein
MRVARRALKKFKGVACCVFLNYSGSKWQLYCIGQDHQGTVQGTMAMIQVSKDDGLDKGTDCGHGEGGWI